MNIEKSIYKLQPGVIQGQIEKVMIALISAGIRQKHIADRARELLGVGVQAVNNVVLFRSTKSETTKAIRRLVCEMTGRGYEELWGEPDERQAANN